MIRLETAAANKALTVFINELTSSNSAGLKCHIRSIERRARKDAVDGGDASHIPREGVWPFVYLIEVEGKQVLSSNGRNGSEQREAKRAKVDSDVMAASSTDFSQHIHKALISAQLSDQSKAQAVCLGIWTLLYETR